MLPNIKSEINQKIEEYLRPHLTLEENHPFYLGFLGKYNEYYPMP